MGCTCSCRRQEVPGFSLSSWSCCYRRCCCCGMCSIVHPSFRKRDTSSSLHNVSVPSSTGILTIAPGSILFPDTPLASANTPYNEQSNLSIPCASLGSEEGGPERFSIIRDGGAAPLASPEQIYQKNKESFHVANKKSRGFGSIESILFLPEDDDNCPICLEEYDKENPRIETVCEHHFHLCCILEWMERSDNCPMCDKEIVLYESL